MILGIETSCDDTCAAVIDKNGNVMSSIVSSQDEIHDEFQGVVPELASRKHCEAINTVIRTAMKKAQVKWTDFTSVAVTYGPGLVGSLLTGIAAGKSIASRFDIPLKPINHIEAHVYSIQIEADVEYPFISLVASGGHTALFHVRDSKSYEILGYTRDDAAGEAYDKVAKMLDLGYPGGPEIERIARDGSPGACEFPRPTLQGNTRWSWHMESFDFSFSGVKTAVYYHLDDNPQSDPADVASGFQRAVNDVLVYKTITAAEELEVPRIAIGGGVAANTNLRKSFETQTHERDMEVFFPGKEYCTDNAAMIGLRSINVDETADLTLNASPQIESLTERTPRTEGIEA